MNRFTKAGLAGTIACFIVAAFAVLMALVTSPVGASTPSAVDAGTLTCTTNGQAYCTGQLHHLGTTPAAVLVIAQTPNSGTNVAANLDADQFTATSFRIRVFKPNGSGYNNLTLTYSYAAYAGPTPPPTTTTPAPTTTPPPANSWPTPGTVGLQTTTTHTLPGGRFGDPGDFTGPDWTGTGTQADPYTLSRALVTDKLVLGCACGATNMANVWVLITDSWLQGTVGNPTPGDSRMLQVENDGPNVAVRRTSLRPAGTLDANGIRTDNACADSVLLTYRPLQLTDSWLSGGNILYHTELEQDETGTAVIHNEIHGICSNAGDHTDLYNENGHGSNTLVEANYFDGSRSGGTVVNNAVADYNDNIGQCDACATTRNHTIRENRFVHYNVGVLGSANQTLTLGPQVVESNVFDAPTALGNSPGAAYVARTPTVQSGNTVNGTAVTFS